MELLTRLESYAKDRADVIAFKNAFTDQTITYSQLWSYSDIIAARINEIVANDKSPIVVYGHKSPLMLAIFTACVKCGHPYCPVDISMPTERLKDIVEVSGAKLLIAMEETEVTCDNKLVATDIEATVAGTSTAPALDKTLQVSPSDVYYIIFTSGSTGKPKGVMITAQDLDNYLDWMEGLMKRDVALDHITFLNQAPFSFDLSVMDTYTSLYVGGTIWCMEKRLQEDMGLMHSKLADSGLNLWVSTPSFMNVCLLNKDFNADMMPGMKAFYFCGEVLTNKTARELQKRFPKAKVVNTYGPTESTVAVTEVVVTPDMAASEHPLSIGYDKPGTTIYIMDDKYTYPGKPQGEKGEIVIAGNTVAAGYLNQPKLTNDKFFKLSTPEGDIWAYKTGDEGYKQDDLLYYCGRMDFQLKLNGYRIELGDIESNILEMSDVTYCVVLPIEKRGEVKGLAAFITLDHEIEDEFEYSQSVRKYLGEKLPHYMIPKKCIVLSEMPMTNNGKADRRALKEML